MSQPFVGLNDSPANFSKSPDTSYTRDNIAVPAKTLGRSAANVALRADTAFEDFLPAGTTTASVPTPADAGE